MGIEKIENLPEYAYQYRYIVYRMENCHHYWFWGAYSDAGEACEAAKAIDGYVLDRGIQSERSSGYVS